MNRVNLRTDFGHDDSTINIVMAIVIIINVKLCCRCGRHHAVTELVYDNPALVTFRAYCGVVMGHDVTSGGCSR